MFSMIIFYPQHVEWWWRHYQISICINMNFHSDIVSTTWTVTCRYVLHRESSACNFRLTFVCFLSTAQFSFSISTSVSWALHSNSTYAILIFHSSMPFFTCSIFALHLTHSYGSGYEHSHKEVSWRLWRQVIAVRNYKWQTLCKICEWSFEGITHPYIHFYSPISRTLGVWLFWRLTFF